MRKIRLYFDTSAICKMFNPRELAEKEIDATIAMFEFIEEHRAEFELIISPVTQEEIEQCPDFLFAAVLHLVERFQFARLPKNEEALDLAKRYIEGGVLGKKHKADLTHIAYATAARCDYIVSWNFKHFVNTNTITRVKTINDANNYVSPLIISPFSFKEVQNAGNL